MHVVGLIPILRLRHLGVMVEKINGQEGLEITSDNLSAAIELSNLVLIKDSLSDFEI